MSSQRTQPTRAALEAPADVSTNPGALSVAVLALAAPLMVTLAIVAALIPGVPWWLGVLIGLAIAGVAVWLRLRAAHDVVVDELLGSRGSVTSVRLTNMVQALSLVVGVAEPEAFVLETEATNAAIVSRGDQATIFITRGLDDLLEPVELEAVVAELLVRLRTGDAEAATITAALYHIPLLGPLSKLALSPVAAAGLGRMLTSERDLVADRQAVVYTRYPPGLLAALVKMTDGPRRPGDLGSECDLLWLVEPDPVDSANETRSPLELRIDVLAEL